MNMDPETRKTLNEQLDAMWSTINEDGTTYDDTAAKEIDRLNKTIDIAESRAEDYEKRAIYWEERAKGATNHYNHVKAQVETFLTMIGVANCDIRYLMDPLETPQKIYEIGLAYMREHTSPPNTDTAPPITLKDTTRRNWIKEAK